MPTDLIVHNHGSVRPTINCLNHGFVSLVDVMPRISYDDAITTCDHAIVQAARVSYGDGTKKVSEDRGLIRYLMRHRHTTPMEMIEMKFHCAMPIFVARQFIRHRTANVNEYSGRYSVIKDDFWIPSPDDVRLQSSWNKQVSEGAASDGDGRWFMDELDTKSRECYEAYEQALEKGIGREQARAVLPVNVYTQWYWKCDIHNILHFLALRCDDHAQYEIRVFADAMLALIEPLIPWTIEAWNDYHPMRGGMLLTRLEIEAMRASNGPDQYGGGQSVAPSLDSDNKREGSEWAAKADKLGFLPR